MASGDDFLDQALAKVTQQAAATNPYMQFGNLFAQQKNPATANDPWGSIAAGAVQNLVSGMATGYGQAQVQNDLSQIAPILPQLYQDPSTVQNPGIDPSIFNTLQIGGIKNQQEQQRELAKFFQQETIKSQLNPQAGLYGSQKRLADLDLIRGLNEFQLQQQAMREAQGGAVQPNTTAAAAPLAAPTQGVAAPSNGQQDAVPGLEQLRQKYLALGQPFQKANEAAIAEQGKVLDENRKRVTSASEIQNKAKADQEKSELEALTKRQQAFDNINLAVSQMEGAMENLPDYGGTFGGMKSMFDENAARYLPEGSSLQKGAAEKQAAAAKMAAASPIVLGPIRQQLMPGSLTEKELQFLFKLVPDEFKLSSANQEILGGLRSIRDLSKLENLYISDAKGRGKSLIEAKTELDGIRSQLGGSLIDDRGSLKMETKKILERLGGNL